MPDELFNTIKNYYDKIINEDSCRFNNKELISKINIYLNDEKTTIEIAYYQNSIHSSSEPLIEVEQFSINNLIDLIKMFKDDNRKINHFIFDYENAYLRFELPVSWLNTEQEEKSILKNGGPILIYVDFKDLSKNDILEEYLIEIYNTFSNDLKDEPQIIKIKKENIGRMIQQMNISEVTNFVLSANFEQLRDILLAASPDIIESIMDDYFYDNKPNLLSKNIKLK